MLNIIIISDEAKKISSMFRTGGFTPDTVSPHQQKAPSGAKQPNLRKYDLALLDLDNKGWQKRLLTLRQQMPVVAFSRPDIKNAVEAMKLGASDFIAKPLTSEILQEVISRFKKDILTHKYGFDALTGVSRPMQEIFSIIRKAAASDSNVLITGESGTGKELVARAIHRWSPRSENAFMTINCSAIPDTLLESELFGFEKGSFTGANYTKKGLMESADRGTVFFDEIGDVSPLFQIKILRLLQEGEIMRIGGTGPIRVDLRIISATNKDLNAARHRGTFREDLFYRLNVINIHIPPLRERKDDIPDLTRHFIGKYSSKRKDVAIKGITDSAIKMLIGYSYPGNVRELENIVERAVSFTNTNEILPSDLPSYLKDFPEADSAAKQTLKDAVISHEKQVILSALHESGGNISRAATLLGIYRQQLQRKIKTLDIAT